MNGLNEYQMAAFAKNEVLWHLNSIRRDPDAMEEVGVTEDQVKAAFEVVRAVSDHYSKEQAA